MSMVDDESNRPTGRDFNLERQFREYKAKLQSLYELVERQRECLDTTSCSHCEQGTTHLAMELECLWKAIEGLKK